MAKKLSDAQIKALNEINELGYTNARANTLNSVSQYITSDNSGDEPRLILNTDGREVMGLPSLGANPCDDISLPNKGKAEVKTLPVYTDGYDLEALDQTQEEIELDAEYWASDEHMDADLLNGDATTLEELLSGDPWKLGDRIEEETYEAYQEIASADVFDPSWSDWAKEVSGFGETLNWKGVEVWDGLTAAEIREDMETATPINRNTRRTHFRTLRNAYRRRSTKQLKDANPSYTRKALKITGAVGL